MKALFVAYSQAFNDQIIELLDSFGQRGFTRWTEVGGRGTTDGIPHMGDHVWPDMNHALLVFVQQEDKLPAILDALREKDAAHPDLGLRAYTWNVENYL